MKSPESRALAAYSRAFNGIGSLMQPRRPQSVEVAGRQYIVLDNVRGVLAVYRVRNDGRLKRLKRWPAELGVAA